MADNEVATGTKAALGVLGMLRRGEGIDVTRIGTPTGGLASIGLRAGLEEPRSIPRVVGEAILPGVLSAGGAAAGAFAGGVPGALMGAGVGAAAGEGLNDYVFPAIGLEPPKSQTGSRLLDMLITGAGGTVGQGVGQAVTAAGRVATRAVTPAPSRTATATRDAFRDAGVPLKLSDVSPNMAALERSVVQTPTGGPIIREAADAQALALTRAKDDFLRVIGPAHASERVAVGGTLADTITRTVERTGKLEDHLWRQISDMAADMPVGTRNLKLMADNILLEQQRRLPAQRNAQLIALANEVKDAGDVVGWQIVDAWRKGFGEAVKAGELISKVPSGSASAFYRASLTDMEAAAAQAQIPGLGQAFANVRQFAERRRALFRDSALARVMETDPEKVVDLLKGSGGPSAIARAREAIIGSPDLGSTMPSTADREAWDLFRRHVLEGVFRSAVNDEYKGLANPVIVGSKLQKALERIGKDGLGELLTPTEQRALENLVAVAKTMRQSERIGALPGTSTTPQGIAYQALMGAPGAAAGAAVGAFFGSPGVVTGAAGGQLVTSLLVPHAAAKLLTNPRLAEIVASPGFAALARVSTEGARAANAGTKALFRLVGALTAREAGRD